MPEIPLLRKVLRSNRKINSFYTNTHFPDLKDLKLLSSLLPDLYEMEIKCPTICEVTNCIFVVKLYVLNIHQL